MRITLSKLLKFKPDFPLSQDDANRMMPWIIAFMVYLACTAMIVAINLNHYVAAKSTGFSESITIQIPGDSSTRDADSASVVSYLKTQEFVNEVNILSDAEVKEMVEPWLGKGNVIDSLPLPIIIEAGITEGFSINTAQLAKKMSEINSRIEVGSNEEWMASLNRIARGTQAVAIGVVVLVSVVVVSIVILVARTSLKLHSGSVEILSFIGATDDYVANQFQKNAMIITLKGTITGILAAFLTLFPLGLFASGMDWLDFPMFRISFIHIFAMFMVLAFTAFVAYFAARTTVVKMLSSQT